MKKLSVFAGIAAGVLLSGLALAASTKTYQVTANVIAVNEDMIVVMKGNDRWEIMRDANTKFTDTIAVGDKVTITYRMRAESVEKKPAAKTKTKTK
jgi:hypothetical protein